MDFSTSPNNIISYLYGYTSKSFREFYSDFYQFKQHSNNYLITDDYIIFDNIKPSINEDIEKQYITLQEFYKYSKQKKKLNNLICLYYYKFKTITKIRLKKEDKIINIYNPYKELSRTITYPEDNDFTHLLTITYKHDITITTKHNKESEIFEIINNNERLRKKVNNGIHRMRNYVYKVLKDELKKKISNKELLNKKVKELKRKVFKYFKVYELHKSNQIHAHILVKLPSFITKLDFKEIINKMSKWFETELQGIDLKRIKKGNGVKRYVLKYMFKQFTNDNVFYIENEKQDKIYLIKKEALIRNDIPRMISKSRNVKVKKFKPFFTIQEEDIKQGEEIKGKEITRFEMGINKKDHNKFKEILKQFKTKREKNMERIINEAEKRSKVIQKMQWYIEDRYFSIDDIQKCIDYARNDRIIQERYRELYYQTVIKFNKDLEEIDRILEEDEEIDF
jgi:hypothetical protein